MTVKMTIEIIGSYNSSIVQIDLKLLNNIILEQIAQI